MNMEGYYNAHSSDLVYTAIMIRVVLFPRASKSTQSLPSSETLRSLISMTTMGLIHRHASAGPGTGFLR